MIGIAALILLALTWAVFSEETIALTEEEQRISSILCMLDGIEEARVFISSEADVRTAVVIYSGNDGILLRSDILNLVSDTLGIEKKNISLYPKS